MGNLPSKKYLAIGILCLFIGANTLPIVSGAQQNLITSKAPQTHGNAKHTKTHDIKTQQTTRNKVLTHPTIPKVEKTKSTKTTKVKPSIKRDLPFTVLSLEAGEMPASLNQPVPSATNNATLMQRSTNEPQPLDTYWVRNINTNEEFNTIQEAVNSSNTLSGHTLLLNASHTFSEHVEVTKSLTICGNNATTIIDGKGGTCFNITANSVTLKWLNITNSTYAINCTAAGFTIQENTFFNDTNGFSWLVKKSQLSTNQNLPASTITKNKFYSNSSSNDADMIYADLDLFFDNGTHTVTIGDITITHNTFFLNNTLGTDAIDLDSILVYYLGGGTVTVGKTTVSDNQMYGGHHGIYFWGEFYHLKNVQVTAGNFVANSNVMLNQWGYGMEVYYYDAEDWSGSTHGVFGRSQITDNTLDSNRSYEGINYNLGDSYNFSGTAYLHFGDVTIQNNIITADDYGIDFEVYTFGQSDDPLSGSSQIILGNFTINGNTVTSLNEDGIYIYWDEVGYYMYNSASLRAGNFYCDENTITTTASTELAPTDNISGDVHLARGYDHGLYNAVTETYYQTSSPADTEWSPIYTTPQSDPTVLSYSAWKNAVNNNPPNMVNHVIYMHIISEDRYFQMNFTWWQQEGGGGFSYDRYEVINGTVGPGVTFTRPNTARGGEGIYIDYIDDSGYNMYNSSVCTFGNFQFDNNTITSEYEGIDFSWIGDIGENLYDQARCTMGDFEANDNSINSSSSYGIYYDVGCFGYDVGDASSDHCVFSMGDFTCKRNTIVSEWDGIYVSDFEECGYDLYGSSTVTLGDIVFTDNIVNATNDDGIYFDDIYELGYDLYDNSQFTMGDFKVLGNTVTAGDGDGIYAYIEEIGYDLENNAVCKVGNFLFNENTINASSDGIDFDYLYEIGYDLYDNAKFTMGNIECTNNVVESYDDALYIDVYEIGYDMEGSSTCTLGSILLNSNYLHSTNNDGLYIDEIYEMGYDMYGSAKYSMGDIQVNFNTIIGGNGYGIKIDYYDFGYNMGNSETDTCAFNMGNMTFNYNNITSSDDGIYTCDLEDIGYDMYGASTCHIGNIEFSHNVINSTGSYGMDLSDPEEFGYDLYNTAQFTMGHFAVDDNSIIAGNGNGIYMYYNSFGYAIGDTSSDHCAFSMGDITCNRNTIKATGGEGIYVDDFEEVGYDIYGSSICTIGNVTFNNNIVNVNDSYDGIYIYDLYDFGYYLYDDSVFKMGSVQINNNIVNSGSVGIDLDYIGDFGEYMYNNATFAMNSIEANQNIINSTGDGIYVYIEYIADEIYDQASFTMNDITINNNNILRGDNGIDFYESGWICTSNIDTTAPVKTRGFVCGFNTINATNAGIVLDASDGIFVGGNTIVSADSGIDLTGGSDPITVAYNHVNGVLDEGIYVDNSYNNMFLANNVSGSQTGPGFYFSNSNGNTITRNVVSNNNGTGIYMTSSSANFIYHNNIINNTAQAYDDDLYNAWNTTYPTGGNYWSDYNGTDAFSGAHQDVAGSDGIGDTPYNINGTENADFYPLMGAATINHPPLMTPNSPSPADGADGVSTTPTLSWNGGDPDHDYNNYDVYFGTTATPTIVDTIYLTNLTTISWTPGKLAKDTTYYWKIVAWDAFNDTVNGPVWSFYTGTAQGGEPPQNDHFVPTAIIGGPYYGIVNQPVTFDGSASHANKQFFTIQKYEWRFFDGDSWHDLSAKPTHTYANPGTYNVALTVYDNDNYTGVDTTTVTISSGGNSAPTTPSISGSKTGSIGGQNTYSFTATDPNGDNVQYFIDWGDTTTATSGQLSSGSTYQASHTWSTGGIYNITAYAKDSYAASSGTARYTVFIGAVTIPGQGYFIDGNGDGVYDSYFSNATGHTCRVQQQADGTYLIDTNGDGTWDTVYNPATGSFSAYSAPLVGGVNIPLWSIGLLVIIIIVVILLILLLVRRRKKDDEDKKQ